MDQGESGGEKETEIENVWVFGTLLEFLLDLGIYEYRQA